jgi:hypothetical protein
MNLLISILAFGAVASLITGWVVWASDHDEYSRAIKWLCAAITLGIVCMLLGQP